MVFWFVAMWGSGTTLPQCLYKPLLLLRSEQRITAHQEMQPNSMWDKTKMYLSKWVEFGANSAVGGK
jgi:hypothetical protein